MAQAQDLGQKSLEHAEIIHIAHIVFYLIYSSFHRKYFMHHLLSTSWDVIWNKEPRSEARSFI